MILSGVIKLKYLISFHYYVSVGISVIFLLFIFESNAQTIISRWDFEGDLTTPSIGSGISSLIGGTTATFAGGDGGGRGWNTTNYPGISLNNGTAGVQFAISTVGFQDIQLSFSHRASAGASRWARVDYSLDGGTSWTTSFWNNNGILTPHDNFYNFSVDFSAITGANNNANFVIRIVSIFSPQAFNQNSSLSYGANNNYMRANNDAKYSPTAGVGAGIYATTGTWRFDNVAFIGNTIVSTPLVPFQNCNLLVYRVGDGSTTLDNSAKQVSLVEVSSAGALVQNVNNYTGVNILTQSGSATSNGFFNTYNGFVGLPGHNEAIGTASVNSNNSKRTLIFDNNLNYYPYNLQVSAPIPFDSDNFRSVVPTSVNTFYASGNGSSNNGGIWYFNGSTYVQLLEGNIRNIEIFNDTLYFSAASSAFGDLGVYKLSNGLPISGTNQPFEAVVTYVSSITTAGPYGFSISPDGCILYIADAGSTGAGSYPGISKWVRSGAIYNYAYSFSTNALGIVVDYSSINPVIYATTAQSQNNNLIKITDSGPSSITSTILSSGGNYVFKGIDFTPSSTVAITISQQPQAQTVCENEATFISVSSASSVSLTYQWYSNLIDSYCGASPVSGATYSTFSPPVSNSGTTYYFVKIVSLCSSIVFSNRVAVIVNEPVNPSFTSISAICPGGNFSLPTSSNNSISGIWSPSNNTNETTNYVFTPNVGQCANSTSMTVQVYKAPKILALSPP